MAEEKKELYQCECLDCGEKFESEEHCEKSVCPKCEGNNIRRVERPGKGKEAAKVYAAAKAKERASRRKAASNLRKKEDKKPAGYGYGN